MTIVDELHRNYAEILAIIPENEISLRNVASEGFRKGLLLSAASLFERRLLEIIRQMVREWGRDNALLNEFVRIKAVERQYHTYFDWERPNANRFFGLFGDGFKAFMAKRCKSDGSLDDGIQAFMEIGRERNRLVHQDFGAFAFEKTSDEIFQLYLAAERFVTGLEACFADYISESSDADATLT